MRQNLEIYEVEEMPEAATGKIWWIAKTNKGPHSIWDEDIANELIEGQGTICDVEVEKKGKYRNITAFNGSHPVNKKVRKEVEKEYEEDDEEEEEEDEKESYYDKKQKRINEASRNKLKSISVGYAEQMYMAEITALVPRAKDMEEAKKIIEERKAKIFETAKGFYNLIKTLDEEVKEKE